MISNYKFFSVCLFSYPKYWKIKYICNIFTCQLPENWVEKNVKKGKKCLWDGNELICAVVKCERDCICREWYSNLKRRQGSVSFLRWLGVQSGNVSAKFGQSWYSWLGTSRDTAAGIFDLKFEYPGKKFMYILFRFRCYVLWRGVTSSWHTYLRLQVTLKGNCWWISFPCYHPFNCLSIFSNRISYSTTSWLFFIDLFYFFISISKQSS